MKLKYAQELDKLRDKQHVPLKPLKGGGEAEVTMRGRRSKATTDKVVDDLQGRYRPRSFYFK
ncbi:MAG: hypothetical protein HS127_10995 [Planctomycetia bacterium]|nr:hypothetical protein [Planctomycetia bacterium]